MQAHILTCDKWFFNKRYQDWDYDPYFLVVQGDQLREIAGNSDAVLNSIKEQYPDHVVHDIHFSAKRNLVPCEDKFSDLRNRFPDVWKTITRKYSIA